MNYLLTYNLDKIFVLDPISIIVELFGKLLDSFTVS